jgi:hypothetical protein
VHSDSPTTAVGDANGQASATADIITAAGFAPKGGVGAGAGEAIDPFTLPPGVYQDYAPVIDLQLQIDTPADVVGASFFANDSRFSDPLWSLGISAQGVLSSNADLQIQFASNPILGLNDALIASQIRSAFTVSSGTATLSSYQLFDTTYTVDQSVTYSDDVNAGASTLPEPSSLVLLATALPALLGPGLKRLWRGRGAGKTALESALALALCLKPHGMPLT